MIRGSGVQHRRRGFFCYVLLNMTPDPTRTPRPALAFVKPRHLTTRVGVIFLIVQCKHYSDKKIISIRL